jgi:hypothetical protein
MRIKLLATTAAALAVLAVSSTPTTLRAQETRIIQCICVTTTRTEPIMFLGFQIGTRTITESQCWYD